MKECDYQFAEAALSAENYASAQKKYDALNGYSDSAAKIMLCTYEQANTRTAK